MLHEMSGHAPEKACELIRAHLAAAHGEVAMTNEPQAAGMAVDRRVVGRVREHQMCALFAQQVLIGSLRPRVSAQEPVATEVPKIARLGDCRPGRILRDRVSGTL